MKLKPCPFCGGKYIKYFGANGDTMYCRSCYAEGPKTDYGTLKEAKEQWNKRYKE